MKRALGRIWIGLLCVWVLSSVGCRGEDDTPPALRTITQPVEAYCVARVVYPSEGREVLVDVEEDYLPHVITCENGNADFEALKAQAVAARSYLYYRMNLTDSIEDGQQDQVFTCSRPPSDRHYQAVAETAGEVLLNADGNVIAAFYVAGAIPSTTTCVPASGDSDPTNTERFVTYNWGKSGTQVTPSPLGHPASPYNRGCQSQNGAHCLASEGWNYQDILRFYYGMDIQIVPAEGACLAPFRCPTLAVGAPTVVSEQSACFIKSCATGDGWYTDTSGEGGEATFTLTIDAPAPQCWGRWSLLAAQSGRYAIEVYVEDIGPMSQQAPYKIRHAGGAEHVVRLSQEGGGGWVPLAVVELDGNASQWVELYDNTGEPYTGLGGTRVVFDALRVTPTTAPLTDLDALPPEDIGPSDVGVGEDTTGDDTGLAEDTEPQDTTADTASAQEDTASSSDILSAADAGIVDDTNPTGRGAFKTSQGEDCACNVRAQNQGQTTWWYAAALLGLWAWRRRR